MSQIKYDKTRNSLRNSIYGIVFRLINLAGAFVVRTLMIHIMGIEFMGLDGLFSSILQLLSLAELGFSSAIVFKLYKPLADGDDERVCALLRYYRTIYRVIGAIILILGLILIPFLSNFINGDVPAGVNIYVLYMIYLLNACLSYWLFAYRTAILSAAQRNDLQSKVSSLVLLLKYIVQIILLLACKNYYTYVLVIPLTTILTNIGNMLITRKHFPQYTCSGQLSKNDKKEINKKVTALMYNKLGVTMINGSQSIIISSFMNLAMLGIYNSYYYIFSMLYSFFDIFHTSIAGGIGNSIVTETKEKNYILFRRISFANNWVVAWCSICLLCLYRPFMLIWVGEENTLPNLFSLLMALYFYIWMVRFITSIFKSAQGLWVEDRFRALIEGIVTVGLGIVLVNLIGIYGVVISTIAAQLIISMPWETYVLYKKYFNISIKYFYGDLLLRFIISALAGIASFLLCSLINISPVFNLILSAATCLIVPNIIFYIFFRRTDEFIFMVNLIKRLLTRFSKNKSDLYN